MNGWVSAPVPLNDRMLVIEEGTAAVILRDGQVWDVRGPGRHGGLLRTFIEGKNLPWTGALKVMIFQRAPAVSDPVKTQVRLVDGATVDVTVTASITPRWKENPAVAGDAVREYGTDPRRIEQGEQIRLQSSISSMIVTVLSNKTHDQVHAYHDKRMLLGIPRAQGLLQVREILYCEISRDRHIEDSHVGQRDAVLAAMRAEWENKIEVIRLSGRLGRQHQEAISQAQMHTAVARMLGVPVTDVAFPGSRQIRESAKYEAAVAVLRDNLDIVPLLADPAAAGASQQLVTLLGGLFNGAGEPATPITTELPPGAGGVRLKLLRQASMGSAGGVLNVQLVASGEDRVIGHLGGPGPHRLLVVNEQNPVNVAKRALHLAGTWCGVQVRANISESGVYITAVETGDTNPSAQLALGTWIAGINQVLDGRAQINLQT